MTRRPFFSIVIPTYNRAEDLQFALYCIFRQTFSDFEVVVSDNCSTDNTQYIVEKIKDDRLRYFKTKNTLPINESQGSAFERAKGKYIFIHSDDDFILYPRSLEEIYNTIIKRQPGYIRINYVSLSPEKKRIFYYRIAKPFIKDEYFPPLLDNKKTLSIILDSDPYFISGLIFKNELSKGVKIINSEPMPFIDIMFDVIKNFGACYIAKPHIVASWSRREIKKNQQHHLFALVDGKLRFEKYLEVVKKKVNAETYAQFVHRELMHICVLLFPAMKVTLGGKKIIAISKRILTLDPTMEKNVIFWICLVLALLFPGGLLKVFRNMFLTLFSRYAAVEEGNKIYATIKNLEENYRRSNH